jgi:hypothetical protein
MLVGSPQVQCTARKVRADIIGSLETLAEMGIVRTLEDFDRIDEGLDELLAAMRSDVGADIL